MRSWRIGIGSPLLFAAAALLVFLAVAPFTSPALGDTESDALKQQFAQKQAALEKALAELRLVQREMDGLAADLDGAAVRLGELDMEIRDADVAIAAAEHDRSLVQAQVDERLVSLYKNGSSWAMCYLEVLFVEADVVSVIERLDALSTIARQDQELFAEVDRYVEQSRVGRALLDDKRAEQQETMERLTQVQEEMVAKRADFAARHQSLKTQVSALAEEIEDAEALEAAAVAAAAAQAQALDEALTAATATTATTSPATTPTTAAAAKPGGDPPQPTVSADIAAQAAFIDKTFLAPRQSVLTGRMVMDVWARYDISPAATLTVLNAETGMGSLRSGGNLVTVNNFGCIKYREDPVWLRTPPPAIPYGRIEVAGYSWFTFPSPAEGMEAWARAITYGLGRDCYRPLLRAADWAAFADIYYGKNVPGKAQYIENLRRTYQMVTTAARAAGYTW